MGSDALIAELLQEYTFEGKMYSITPAIVFYLMDKKDASIYIKNGIILGNCSYIENGLIQELYPNENNQSVTNKLEYSYKFEPKWSIGNKTGFGLDIALSKVVKLFIESDFNYIQYKPDRAKREDYHFIDEYELFTPAFPSEIEFVDEYTYEDDGEYRINYNSKELKRSISFSSFEFQTGLKFVW